MTGELRVDRNIYPTTGVLLPHRQGRLHPHGLGGFRLRRRRRWRAPLWLAEHLGLVVGDTDTNRLAARGLRHDKFHTTAL